MTTYHLPAVFGGWQRIDTVELSHPTDATQLKEPKMPITEYSQVRGDLDATSYVAPPEPELLRIARQNRERESDPYLVSNLAQDDEWFEMYKTTEAHAVSMNRRASVEARRHPPRARRSPERSEVFENGRPVPAPYVTSHVITPADDSPEDREFLRRAQRQDRPHCGGREMEMREQWRRADQAQQLAEYHDALIQSFTG